MQHFKSISSAVLTLSCLGQTRRLPLMQALTLATNQAIVARQWFGSFCGDYSCLCTCIVIHFISIVAVFSTIELDILNILQDVWKKVLKDFGQNTMGHRLIDLFKLCYYSNWCKLFSIFLKLEQLTKIIILITTNRTYLLNKTGEDLYIF